MTRKTELVAAPLVAMMGRPRPPSVAAAVVVAAEVAVVAVLG